MAILRNLENKIKLVMIVSLMFMTGCVVISLGSIFAAKTMVSDAHKKIYVLDGKVPIIASRTNMDETFDVEAKSHIETFHNLFSPSPPTTSISSTPSGRRCTSLTRAVRRNITR